MVRSVILHEVMSLIQQVMVLCMYGLRLVLPPLMGITLYMHLLISPIGVRHATAIVSKRSITNLRVKGVSKPIKKFHEGDDVTCYKIGTPAATTNEKSDEKERKN